jgi:ribosomal-protein-alanine N-acetyltransferase
LKLDRLASVPPVLELGICRLRPLQPEDAAAWYGYLSDPEVTQLTSYDVSSIDTVKQFIAAYVSDYDERRSSRWAIAETDSNQLIGTCGYYGWNPKDGLAELGYDLARRFWGKGVMTRAVKAVVEWGFNVLEINRIQATVMVGNSASLRVLEKCRFQQEGLLRELKICRGTPQDFWMFAQLRRDYNKIAD